MQRRAVLTGIGATVLCPICAQLGHAAEKAHAPEALHWAYEGDHGPLDWADTSPDFKSCKIGTGQSPINLHDAIKADLPALVLAYQPSVTEIVHNGHTIQVNVPQGSTFDAGPVRHDLLQFHFHHPSEHTVAGQGWPMEAHFVHRKAGGDFGVVGVMLTPGTANASFAAIIAAMPRAEGKATAGLEAVDPRGLLPADLAHFRYEGSLTTPPCSETVDWFVLKAPVEVAAADIAAFGALFPLNARPVQEEYRRFVLSSN